VEGIKGDLVSYDTEDEAIRSARRVAAAARSDVVLDDDPRPADPARICYGRGSRPRLRKTRRGHTRPMPNETPLPPSPTPPMPRPDPLPPPDPKPPTEPDPVPPDTILPTSRNAPVASRPQITRPSRSVLSRRPSHPGTDVLELARLVSDDPLADRLEGAYV